MKFASTGSLPLSMGLTQTLARDYVGSDSALDTAREELYRALKQLLRVSEGGPKSFLRAFQCF